MTDRHLPGYKRPMPQRQIGLPPEQWEWLKAQGKGQPAQVIRRLIEQAMKGESDVQGA